MRHILFQAGVTLERQLSKAANVAFTYLQSRGDRQLYINNLNLAYPVTGLRPNVDAGNLFQYQSEGTFKQKQLIVNGSVRLGAKLSLFGLLRVELFEQRYGWSIDVCFKSVRFAAGLRAFRVRHW